MSSQPQHGKQRKRQPTAPELQKPHDQPVEWILRRVWDRLNTRNEHFVMTIVGREGIGKSHTVLKIASLIDDEFTPDQVYFRLDNFLELLRDEEYREGAFYVLDEAGVSMGNRTWQDRAQILANQALQLIRSHNVGLGFTLPRLGELDSQTQGRLQAFYEITDKKDGEHVKGKWKWIDPDRSDTTGELYKKFPRRRVDGRLQRIKRVGFSPPPPEIIEPYEAKKQAFQKEVYDDVITEMRDDVEEDLTPNEVAEQVREEGVDSYITEINNGTQRVLDKDLIAAEYDIGRRKAKRVKKLLRGDVEADVL